MSLSRRGGSRFRAAGLSLAVCLAAPVPALASEPSPRDPAGVERESASTSVVRRLAALAAGDSPPGAIIPVADLMAGGTAVTAQDASLLGPGHVYPRFTMDVEGDGLDEIVEIRTSPKFRVRLVDGRTGTERWNMPLRTDNVHLTPIPAGDGPGQDILFLSWTPGDGRFHVAVIDAATGNERWDRPAPAGAGLGWFGVARHGSELDLLTGVWADGGSPLTLEFLSLATGAVRATTQLLGTLNAPSAVAAGDLDGDGNDDLYALEPHLAVPTMASTATLRALGDRGAETIWRTQTLLAPAETTALLGSVDASDDGLPDPVIISTWFGEPAFVPVSPPQDTIVIVEGMAGPEAGLLPLVRHRLEQIVYSVVAPGDIDGDGGGDLVFSGVQPTTQLATVQRLLFEAVGPSGDLWTRRFEVSASWNDFLAWWWPHGGDLDGDGVEDAVVLLGAYDDGWLLNAGVSQDDGTSVWERRNLEDGLTMPVGADLDGDGTDDVLDRYRASRQGFQTHIEVTAAGGDDLGPLWSRTDVLDRETTVGTWWASGSFGGRGAGADLALFHNTMTEPYRHVAVCLDGADGRPLWTSPQQL